MARGRRDARLHPRPRGEIAGDVVWIGNWGDEERTAELHEFFIDPVRELGLRLRVYGVRYPPEAIAALARAGIELPMKPQPPSSS